MSIPTNGGFRPRYFDRLRRWADPTEVDDADLDPDPARNQEGRQR